MVEVWVLCPICLSDDLEINMFKCETCGLVICDDCYFSCGECRRCFNNDTRLVKR